MKKTSIALVSLTMSLLAAALVVPNTALAQPGSRLCGWYTTMGDTTGARAIGFLTELRETESAYGAACDEDELNAKFEKYIKNDATLASYTWTKVQKNTCESVGQYFTSANQINNDICDSMTAYTHYKILKEPVSLVKNLPATPTNSAKTVTVTVSQTTFNKVD